MWKRRLREQAARNRDLLEKRMPDAEIREARATRAAFDQRIATK